jgi:hypothetical protein
MNKLIFIFIAGTLMLSTQLSAQVLIAPVPDDPHPSAALEIRSESGGLLIPNIELSKVGSDVVAPSITTPADGLLIFHDGNTSTGDPSGLPKGLWIYDGSTSRWMIYSRVGSIYSSSLDNFGELHENQEMGSGTQLTINNLYSIPWSSASEGWMGPGFSFIDDAMVNTQQLATTAIADQLTITSNKAYYTVDVSTTLTTGSSGNIVSGQLFINDIPEDAIFFRHAFQALGEYVNCAASGIVILSPGDEVDFRFKTTSANETIFVEHLNLKLTKIGDFVEN